MYPLFLFYRYPFQLGTVEKRIRLVLFYLVMFFFDVSQRLHSVIKYKLKTGIRDMILNIKIFLICY